MIFPLKLHPLAEDDLEDAWEWYEEQQQGLGDGLLDSVRSTLDMVTRWPGSGTPTTEDASGNVIERRVITQGFPYIIRYRTIDEVIVVMAVYHHHRHPNFGTERTI